MVGRLPFPTFNTHLTNSCCSLELVAMTRMLIWRWKIVTCCQRCNQGNEAFTVFLSSFGNNRQDLSKIPTKDHSVPTKDFFSCLASSNCIKSRRVRLTTSKAKMQILWMESLESLFHCSNIVRQMLEMVGGKSFPCHPMWFQCFLFKWCEFLAHLCPWTAL
jgi:hypothetical protein